MKKRSGFSLVEMLAAVTVFAVLVAMMARIVGDTSSVILNARKALDADSQARLIFGLLTRDFTGMLKSGDADLLFVKNDTGTGNDEMYFFSQTSAYDGFDKADKSKISLVGYRVAADPEDEKSLQLHRLSLGLSWTIPSKPLSSGSQSDSNRDMVTFLSYASGSSAPLENSTIEGRWRSLLTLSPTALKDSSFYSFVGPQVFRFEYCFLLKDGTYSNFPVIYNPSVSNPTVKVSPAQDSAPSGGNIGDRWFDTRSLSNGGGRAYICLPGPTGTPIWRGAGLQDVTAIVVSLAILDQNSRKIVPDTRNLPGLFIGPSQATLYPDTKGAELMQKTWQNKADSPGFASNANLPQLVASQVRIYQRYFYVNTPSSGK